MSSNVTVQTGHAAAERAATMPHQMLLDSLRQLAAAPSLQEVQQSAAAVLGQLP